MTRALARSSTLAASIALLATPAGAQLPEEGEVRQLVTFRFLPGRSAEALEIFRDQAVPLYRDDAAMRSFRGFREVESPVPLDLVVVSAFDGMAGMDDSNRALRALAEEAGTSIGAVYGAIASLSAAHDDQFVAMRPQLTTGDPSGARLTAFLWYRIVPGETDRFERLLRDVVVPREREAGVPTVTGRFLVSDGWSVLRILGFASLGAYQRYWEELADAHRPLAALTAHRREVILAPVPELSVR